MHIHIKHKYTYKKNNGIIHFICSTCSIFIQNSYQEIFCNTPFEIALLTMCHNLLNHSLIAKYIFTSFSIYLYMTVSEGETPRNGNSGSKSL